MASKCFRSSSTEVIGSYFFMPVKIGILLQKIALFSFLDHQAKRPMSSCHGRATFFLPSTIRQNCFSSCTSLNLIKVTVTLVVLNTFSFSLVVANATKHLQGNVSLSFCASHITITCKQ